MNRNILLITLLTGVISSSITNTSALAGIENSKHAQLNQWNCYMASDAQERKNQVEHGILPHVVFDEEMKPTSIGDGN